MPAASIMAACHVARNGVARWASRLARCLEAARVAHKSGPVVTGAMRQHKGATNG